MGNKSVRKKIEQAEAGAAIDRSKLYEINKPTFKDFSSRMRRHR